MPYVDEKSIKALIHHYRADKVATCFENPENNLPEPLLAIYSPKSVQSLSSYLTNEKTCVRKFLINSDTHLLKPHDQKVVANWNTPEDLKSSVK